MRKYPIYLNILRHVLKSYQFQSPLSQLLTVLIKKKKQLEFSKEQRNQGIHPLQKSNETLDVQNKKSFYEEQPKVSLKEMFEADGKKQGFYLQNKFKLE